MMDIFIVHGKPNPLENTTVIRMLQYVNVAFCFVNRADD